MSLSNILGNCDSCPAGKFGRLCKKTCDESCQGACNIITGACDCGVNRFWLTNKNRCEQCGKGCKDGKCKDKLGFCECIAGFYGSQCDVTCSANCVGKTCDVHGICDAGCVPGYYGSPCHIQCPKECRTCGRDDGNCHGDCKPGFKGSSCERML